MAECGVYFGKGTLHFPCTVEVVGGRPHDGPHAAVENAPSMRQRAKWESEQTQDVSVQAHPFPIVEDAQLAPKTSVEAERSRVSAPVLEAFVRALVAEELPLGRVEVLVAMAELASTGDCPVVILPPPASQIVTDLVERLLDEVRS